MLHRCKSCHVLYLVSEYLDLCSWCGGEKQRQIERLLETDDAIEWVGLLSIAMHGQQPRVGRRWEVK